MIRLTLQTEPYWIDVVGGARVRVKPLDMTLYQAALSGARTKAGPLIAGASDDAMREAIYKGLFALELAQYGIVEWEGVSTADGETAAEVTPANVETFIRIPAVGSDFLKQYTLSTLTVASEGNA